ncbi:hypothetical protein PMAYCL1PPCAC_23206, partial [Pristionchus mayeri]
VLYIRLLTSSLGVLGTIALFRLRRMAVHRNLAVALAVHCLWTTWMNAAILVDTVIQIYRFMSTDDPNELLISGLECYLRMIPFSMGVYGIVFSLGVIAFERFFATIFYREYERCPGVLSAFICGIQIFVPVVMVLAMSRGYGIDREFAYCTVSTPGNAEAAKGVVFSFLIYEIVALLLHFSLILANKRLLQRWGGTLTERYQVGENLRLLSLLSPVVVCHLLITLSIATAYTLYVMHTPDAADRDYPVLEELANFVHIHGIALPVFIFLRHRLKESRDRRILKTNTNMDKLAIDRYLSSIERGW